MAVGRAQSLSFECYSAEDVKAISVRHVTNELAFDKITGRGVDGGLHDVSLESSLPGPSRRTDVVELEGIPPHELRVIAIRALASRPRTPCKLCSTRAWSIRHINKQQLVMRQASEASRARSSKAITTTNEEEEGMEDVLAAASMVDPRTAPNLASIVNDGSRSLIAVPNVTDGQLSSEAESEMFQSAWLQLAELAGKVTKSKDIFLEPEMARLLLRCLWSHDGSLLCLLIPMLSAAAKSHRFATDMFFLDSVLLSPSICRLPRYANGLAFEHPETAVYSRVVRRAQCLSHIVEFIRQQQKLGDKTNEPVSAGSLILPISSDPDETNLFNLTDASRTDGALRLAYILVQAAVNGLYDCNAAIVPTGLESKVGANAAGKSGIRLPGLRQRLEKKEGLFRMNMMGKRVNYACRSVISPDPNLDVTEVGVPLFFATRLTFPSPVNTRNLTQMRQLVINGPDNYPGARTIQTPQGQLIHLPQNSHPQGRHKRELLAQRIIPGDTQHNSVPFTVNRHLMEGDMLIMNRQPTLHKPSMQAHRVRVIHSTGAKTLRMHYSNCRAYNADFDGDEMNGHLVQSYSAQAELTKLSAVPYHYLSPKDGTPLAGLIQDHVIAAVKLTMRNRFLTEADYMDLVYHALRSTFQSSRESGNGPPDLILLPPAIQWPKRLWTGKQVISTLLMNLTPPGLPHLNCTLRGRLTKAELWSGVAPGQKIVLSDVDLIVCNGYLISGILDKQHIGSVSGGLVHCVHEIHGPQTAAHLLNGISLLANRLLKFAGFTMGLRDMLLSVDANQDRAQRFASFSDLGLCAFVDAFELQPEQLTESNVRSLYRQAQFAPATDQVLCKRLMQLDGAMKNRLKRAQDAVCDAAIPSGLYVGFPENNLQLMVHVGAKGGMVNAQQMSVALGQIELEGRRVPLMLSGRSLPSFPPYDVRPRAGGMCTHRFLTSLPPQELFFHSMAGRDGLVDTAVKTSRSGYLQRSVIKHLEDVSVQYDGTVRDSGQNIIQFRYGDDGVDVCDAALLKPAGLQLLADNARLLSVKWRAMTSEKHAAAFERIVAENPLPKPLQVMADEVGTQRQLILHRAPTEHKLGKLCQQAKLAKTALAKAARRYKRLDRVEQLKADLPPPPCDAATRLRDICVAKLIHSQAPPGDPVGLLAAQSIGEPSTQMTLNTFHFAGRGEMNVTLGIPRLREILMSGSSQISTPCMEVPVRPTNEARRCCRRIAKRLYKLKLVEALKLPLRDKVDYASDSYTLEFKLEPASVYADRTHVKPARVLRFIERVLFPDLAKRLDRELHDQGKTTLIRSFALAALARQQNQATARRDAGEADEDANGDDAAGGQRGAGAADTEWNEDDGHEAVRRRRMESTEPGRGGHLAGNDDDEVIDLALDDDEDDAEAAELREIGVDPETEALRTEEADDAANDEEDETNDAKEGSDAKNKPSGSKPDTKRKKENSGDEDDGDDDEDAELVSGQTESDPNASEMEAKSRKMFVTRLHARFTKYEFDRSKQPTWARLTICMFDPKEGRISIDLRTLVMRIVNKSVVSSVNGVEKVILDKSKQAEWVFRVEGNNIVELMRYPGVFDLTRLYTNSIAIMLQTYGIETARASIQKEVSGVFGHYGIYVDSRHLSLIADYMTKSGAYRAFNRATFIGHSSPVQQMSFETVTAALKQAIQDGRSDNLVSPSASIVTGRLVHNAGTNCFDLYHKLPL